MQLFSCYRSISLNAQILQNWFVCRSEYFFCEAKHTQSLSQVWHDEKFQWVSDAMEVSIHKIPCNIAVMFGKILAPESCFDNFLQHAHESKINGEIWVQKDELIIALIKNKSSKIWRLKFAEAYFHATVDNNNKRGMRQKRISGIGKIMFA